MSSWYQTSLSFQAISPPVRLTTTQCSIVGQASSALSVLLFSGIGRLARRPSSEVMIRVESQSWIRPASASGENPPKTIE